MISRDACFDFFMTAPSKTYTFETISDKCLPEMLSKSVVSREAVLEKSKKRHAIALAAISGCGHLGQSGRLWGELDDSKSNVFDTG